MREVVHARHRAQGRADSDSQGRARGRHGAAADVPGDHRRIPHEQKALDHGAGGGVSAELLRELVTDSYRAVLHTIPRSRRPLGWERYLA